MCVTAEPEQKTCTSSSPRHSGTWWYRSSLQPKGNPVWPYKAVWSHPSPSSFLPSFLPPDDVCPLSRWLVNINILILQAAWRCGQLHGRAASRGVTSRMGGGMEGGGGGGGTRQGQRKGRRLKEKWEEDERLKKMEETKWERERDNTGLWVEETLQAVSSSLTVMMKRTFLYSLFNPIR